MKNQMNYRTFGKTGMKLSQLGFGTMRLPEYEIDGRWYVDTDKTDEMIKRAYDLGVNYFDTAVFYCHENSERALGHAVKNFRDKIYLSSKCPMFTLAGKDEFNGYLKQSLERLGTDYLDVYHFHAINKQIFDEKIVGLGLLDEALRAKADGRIKNIAFSFHDDPSVIKYIIDEGKIFDSMTVQYNLLDRSNEEMIAYAKSKGLGVVVMGPVAGGRLSAPSNLSEKLLGKKGEATSELAMRFVLGNKNVTCALSGMENVDMVEQNAKIAQLTEPMGEDEHNKAKEMMEELKKFSDLYCTGCSYCLPCPKGINIPYVFNCNTYKNVYGLDSVAQNMYSKLTGEEVKSASIDECVSCGKCKTKCPQHIDIPLKLKEVKDSFEK